MPRAVWFPCSESLIIFGSVHTMLDAQEDTAWGYVGKKTVFSGGPAAGNKTFHWRLLKYIRYLLPPLKISTSLHTLYLHSAAVGQCVQKLPNPNPKSNVTHYYQNPNNRPKTRTKWSRHLSDVKSKMVPIIIPINSIWLNH